MKAAAIFTLGILAVAMVPVALAITSRVAENREVDLGVVDGRLTPCPPAPNCACSEYADLDAKVEPLRFSGDPEDAWQALLELLKTLERVELVTTTPLYAHAIFRSQLFRFPDDVEFRMDSEAGTIHVRSASRVGRSDLGVNRKRVELLRERWEAR